MRVTARAEPDAGARIEVTDTGVGIPTAELPHIFDRFYRGSANNEARSAGSGLGLAIAKSIVDLHHGTIAVESRVGDGSRFVVTLPRDPRGVTGVEPAVRESPAGQRDGEPERRVLATAEIRGRNVDDSSPVDDSRVNPVPASLSVRSGQSEPELSTPPERSTSPQ